MLFSEPLPVRDPNPSPAGIYLAERGARRCAWVVADALNHLIPGGPNSLSTGDGDWAELGSAAAKWAKANAVDLLILNNEPAHPDVAPVAMHPTNSTADEIARAVELHEAFRAGTLTVSPSPAVHDAFNPFAKRWQVEDSVTHSQWAAWVELVTPVAVAYGVGVGWAVKRGEDFAAVTDEAVRGIADARKYFPGARVVLTLAAGWADADGEIPDDEWDKALEHVVPLADDVVYFGRAGTPKQLDSLLMATGTTMPTEPIVDLAKMSDADFATHGTEAARQMLAVFAENGRRQREAESRDKALEEAAAALNDLLKR